MQHGYIIETLFVRAKIQLDRVEIIFENFSGLIVVFNCLIDYQFKLTILAYRNYPIIPKNNLLKINIKIF